MRAEPAERPEPAQRAVERLQHLAQELELTDPQKTRITELMQNQRARFEAIRNNEQLSRRKKLKQLRDLRETARLEIRAQLTPEQQKKFDAMPRERIRKD